MIILFLKLLRQQQLAAWCCGAGGVLDSLLDIVGQCTPSKTSKTKAEAAGCGSADAMNIRSNCCSLVSLLIAILASASNVSGKDNVPMDPSSSSLEHSSMNGKGTRGSRDKYAPLLPELPCGWVDFVQMKPTPNPDVYEETFKKGWAAREAHARAEVGEGESKRNRRKHGSHGNIESVGTRLKISVHDQTFKSTVPILGNHTRNRLDVRDHRRNEMNNITLVASDDDTRIGTVKAHSLAPIQRSGKFTSSPRIGRIKGCKGIAPFASAAAESEAQLFPGRENVVNDAPLGLASPGLGDKKKRNTKASISTKARIASELLEQQGIAANLACTVESCSN